MGSTDVQKLARLGSPKRKWTKLGVGIVLIVGMSAGIAWAAGVDTLVPTANYDPQCSAGESAGDVCKTDNKDVYFYMDDSGSYELETGDRDNVNDMLVAEYVPTDFSLIYDSTPVFSGTGETDWIYQEGSDVPFGAVGFVFCSDVVNGSRYHCDQHFIRIQPGEYSKEVACHESGHAAGLLHGSESSPTQSMNASVLGCLRSPKSAITSSDLGSNQVDRINSNY